MAHTIGRREADYRALAAIFGVLSILAAWGVARRIAPDAAGLTALLVATSPFLVYFAKENRAYSLAILLALAATWAFLAGRLGLYAAFSVLLLYTHYFGAFVLLAHETVAGPRDRRWLGVRALTGAAFLPWLIWAAGHLQGQSRAWIGPPLLRLPYAFLRFFLGYGLAAVHDDLRTQPIAVTIREEAPLLLPCLILFLWLGLRGFPRLEAPHRRLFAAVLLLPYAILLPLSPWLPLVHERYLAFQAPFLLCLVAIGLSQRAALRIPVFAVHALGLAAYLIAPARLFGYPFRYGKEDWRSAAAFVDARRPERVICDPPYLHLALDRYRRSDGPPVPGRIVLVRSHATAAPPPGAVEALHLPAHTGIRIYLMDRGPR